MFPTRTRPYRPLYSYVLYPANSPSTYPRRLAPSSSCPAEAPQIRLKPRCKNKTLFFNSHSSSQASISTSFQPLQTFLTQTLARLMLPTMAIQLLHPRLHSTLLSTILLPPNSTVPSSAQSCPIFLQDQPTLFWARNPPAPCDSSAMLAALPTCHCFAQPSLASAYD